MSRLRRARLAPGRAGGSSIAFGVQMLPIGADPAPCPPQPEDGGPAEPGARSIYVEPTVAYGTGTCNWFVVLLGATNSEIEWAITTDEGYEESVLFDESLAATGPIQLVYSISGSVTGIVIYATQDGETVQSEPIECLA